MADGTDYDDLRTKLRKAQEGVSVLGKDKKENVEILEPLEVRISKEWGFCIVAYAN